MLGASRMQEEGTESAARTRLLEEVVLRECLDSNARANQRGVWLTLVLVPFAAWRLGLHAPALQFHYWAFPSK